jgi:hypothetical protein
MDVYGYDLKDGQTSGASIWISNYESQNHNQIFVGWEVIKLHFLFLRLASCIQYTVMLNKNLFH